MMRIVLAACIILTAACGSDGGDGDGGDGDGDGDGDATPTAFRITTLNLRDPHTFALGALDVTDTVDDLIADGINMDADDPLDGILDLSILVVFRPIDQASGSTPMQVVFADCTDAAPTACSPTPMEPPVGSTATNDGAAPCLDELVGTTGGYTPAMTKPGAPCFASDEETFNVALGTITLGMESAIISATYVGDPSTTLTTGLIRGFVTQETADMAIIPEDVSVVGGEPVSALLKDEDKDPGPGGVMGWWFYLNFEATQVSYTP